MRRIHLLHTNDIHSHFDNCSRLATAIKSWRTQFAQDAEGSLLFDLGDHLDRVHPLTEASLGRINAQLLDRMGYDFITLGNNEGITLPKQALDSLYQGVNYEVVLSNLYDEKTAQMPGWSEAYRLVELSGIRLGLIGVTAPFSTFYEKLGWRVEDPVATVKRLASYLRPQVDILILLSHCGIRFDERIVVEVPQLDLVLGAHTHNYFPEGHWVNGRLIAEVGKYGEGLGHVTIEWDEVNHRLEGMVATTYSSQEYGEDEELKVWLSRQEQAAHGSLRQPVIQLAEGLDYSWYEESPLPNLLAIAVRNWTDADIAMVNSGLILRALPKGAVTREMIHQALPHPINPAVMQLKGREIGRVLQHSLDEQMVQQQIRGYGFRGSIFGRMVVDGLTVLFQGKEIHQILFQGEPLQAEQLYRVGMIDMFTFGIGFPELTGMEKAEYYLPEMLRDLLSYELQNPLSIIAAKQNRWIHLSQRRY